MHPLPPRHRLPHASASPAAVEALEGRKFLSGSPLPALDEVASPVTAFPVTAIVGKKFKDAVGNWAVDGGLPTKASGLVATAVVDWGDGKTSHAKLVDDGSGIVQIVASHAWKSTGTFQTTVTVQEAPRKHRHELTEIGHAGGTATVSPKPVKASVKGTATGTYTVPLGGNPDARSFHFDGTGIARALGDVTVAGTITPPGFIKSAPATGELTLTGPTGTVTLELTGHPQPGGSPVPQKMTYVITGGTGAFPNPGGKGTISIALDDSAGTFAFVIH